jgi:hypothetical protein
MTEAEWQACPDPTLMLAFLQGKASDRKLRLFAVGCCRRVEGLIPRTYRNNLPLTEKLADGRVRRRPDRIFGMAGWCPAHDGSDGFIPEAAGGYTIEEDAMRAAEESSRWAALTAAIPNVGAVDSQLLSELWDSVHPAVDAEHTTQADLLRCIFGPLLFRPVDFTSDWRTPTVIAIAQAIYDKRGFDDLPILGDALEDAGCTNTDILEHCRSSSNHVRGCWVVDFVLGKK